MANLKRTVAKLNLHKLNYTVIGLMLGLIIGFFAFHNESFVDKRLRDIAEASYPDDAAQQRAALSNFKNSLNELYDFSESGGVEQVRQDIRNTEARNDINDIAARLEEIYVSNGYYPAELNQASLNDLTYSSLVDREGRLIESEYELANVEPVNTFAGQAPEARYRHAAYDCEQQLEQVACQHYVLFAWLDGAGVYTKKSLN